MYSEPIDEEPIEEQEYPEIEEQVVEEQEYEPSESKPSLEELMDMARSGWHLWYDRRGNRIRLRDPVTRKTVSVPYDEELYKRLKKAKEEGKKARQQEKGEEERGRPRKASPITTDIALWNTFIGKHRPLIESLILRVGWLQDAIIDIGMSALIFAMLVSREEPENLKEVVSKIRDKDEFVGYVMDKLHTLYVAAKGLDEIEELKNRIRELEAENALLYYVLTNKSREADMYRSLAQDYKRKLDIAVSVMRREELREYLKRLTVTISMKGYGKVSVETGSETNINAGEQGEHGET